MAVDEALVVKFKPDKWYRTFDLGSSDFISAFTQRSGKPNNFKHLIKKTRVLVREVTSYPALIENTSLSCEIWRQFNFLNFDNPLTAG